MPADQKNSNKAVTGSSVQGWKGGIAKECKSINDYDVVEWMVPLEDVRVTPSIFHFGWKYDDDNCVAS